MNASKMMLALFNAYYVLFLPQAILGQTAMLDIVHYTPPKGWAKTVKEGVVVFSDTNKSTNAYCLLTIYPTISSVGTPQQDFLLAWDSLVVKPFKAQANPKTDTQIDSDGWQGTAGGAEIEIEGVKAYGILSVFSGFGKTVSVLAIFNDESYVTQLETFTQGIKLDKIKAVTLTNPSVPNNQSTSPAAPVGKAGTLTAADLVGYWTETGAVAGSSPSFGRHSYEMAANGSFKGHFEGMANGHIVKEDTAGTWELTPTRFIVTEGTYTRRFQVLEFEKSSDGTLRLDILNEADGNTMYAKRWTRPPVAKEKPSR